MGPDGLDPVEVFKSLPKSMQRAFESQDMQKLREALQQMPIEEVRALDELEAQLKRSEEMRAATASALMEARSQLEEAASAR